MSEVALRIMEREDVSNSHYKWELLQDKPDWKVGLISSWLHPHSRKCALSRGFPYTITNFPGGP